MTLRLVRPDTPARIAATRALKIAIECLRDARRHPALADVKYVEAYRWLWERVRIEMGELT